ncbi:hypothetical protein WHR41_00805 [Cladosporium halotolerans]|uniref:ORC1/DEAH AAA+ ATPase domain-containing protein n=1 Tax=Cladosporium halotolerans TaxID=1052096 RepID=A0AB34L049_9PEZI
MSEMLEADVKVISSGEGPSRTTNAQPGRCFSVPVSNVPSYTERPHLSRELEEKLKKSYGGNPVAHAVVVVGLGGTGKTQLVRRYIEHHEGEYCAVLWIDVRDQKTARASYVRCAAELGLPCQPSARDAPVQQEPSVQAVLARLRSEDGEKGWLAVVDNADDLSWNVSALVPKGKAGTVIVTSQDGNASRLFGGHVAAVNVDAMEPAEAVKLMSDSIDEAGCLRDNGLQLLNRITEELDRLALAIDLAAAQIRADLLSSGGDVYEEAVVVDALNRYISDYQRNRERLLRDDEFAYTATYKKTVRTVWDTSLASIRRVEERQPGVYPIDLLNFMTYFNRANVQNELFRLASLGLEIGCRRTRAVVPPWLQSLLSRDENDNWDDHTYRKTVEVLVRYRLVRPVSGTWRGLTMHGLVQWWATRELDSQEYWPAYLTFLVAVCCWVTSHTDNMIFRRHLTVHLPSSGSLLSQRLRLLTEYSLAQVCIEFSIVWAQEFRNSEATQLLEGAVEILKTCIGEKDPMTLCVMNTLALAYHSMGRWNIAKDVIEFVILNQEEILGVSGQDTLTSKETLAKVLLRQGNAPGALALEKDVLRARKEAVGEDHPDVLSSIQIMAAIHEELGQPKKAAMFRTQAVDLQRRLHGDESKGRVIIAREMARVFSDQGRWKEAEDVYTEAIAATTEIVGDYHPETLRMLVGLALTYSRQERRKEASDLMGEVVERALSSLGIENSFTLATVNLLAQVMSKQGRWEEAKVLQVKVAEARSTLRGEKHPSTIEDYVDLA